MTLTAYSEHVTEATTTKVVPRVREKSSSGRARFADDICAMHGGTPENPCEKFGHLPGNGRGIVQPGILKGVLVVFRIILKPLFLCGLVFLAGYVLLNWAGGVLRFQSPIPRPNGSVSNINGPAQTNPIHCRRSFVTSVPCGSVPSPTSVHRVGK